MSYLALKNFDHAAALRRRKTLELRICKAAQDAAISIETGDDTHTWDLGEVVKQGVITRDEIVAAFSEQLDALL